MENKCVCCGAVIPEGRLVCPNCESATADGLCAYKFTAINGEYGERHLVVNARSEQEAIEIANKQKECGEIFIGMERLKMFERDQGATEQAYKNGYEQGQKDTAREIYRELCGHGTTYVKKWIKEHYGVKIDDGE